MNKLIKSAASVLLAMSTLAFLSCDDNSDIIGLNDATKYGFIKVTLEGTGPTGDDFEVTKNFKFAPSGAPQNSSSVYTYDDDGFSQEFDVTRYLGPLNAGGESSDSFADLYLYHTSVIPDYEVAELYIQTTITDDNQYFTISEEIDFNEEDVTSYKYNPETGKLSIRFSKQVESNDVEGLLTVTANINVTVFENLNPSFDF